MTGAELRELRKSLKLTARVCAQRVEVTERTWLNWEYGKSTMPPDTEKRFLRRHRADIASLSK